MYLGENEEETYPSDNHFQLPFVRQNNNEENGARIEFKGVLSTSLLIRITENLKGYLFERNTRMI